MGALSFWKEHSSPGVFLCGGISEGRGTGKLLSSSDCTDCKVVKEATVSSDGECDGESQILANCIRTYINKRVKAGQQEKAVKPGSVFLFLWEIHKSLVVLLKR